MSYQELTETEGELYQLLKVDFRIMKSDEEALGLLVAKGYFSGYSKEKKEEIKPKMKDLKVMAFLCALQEATMGPPKEDETDYELVTSGLLALRMIYRNFEIRIPEVFLRQINLLPIYQKYLEKYKNQLKNDNI